MPADLPWAATLRASAGRVTVRFNRPITTIGLSADTARQLAAKLIILAESAEHEGSRFRDKEVPQLAISPIGEPLCRSGCPRPASLGGLCDACVHSGSAACTCLITPFERIERPDCPVHRGARHVGP